MAGSSKSTKKESLSAEERDKLLGTLKNRFEKHPERHKGIKWDQVEDRLKSRARKLWTLSEMERTGGEPDVIGQEKDVLVFCDCSTQSPKGRRSLCYDREALNSRKEHKPKDSAVDMAKALGIDLLTEEQYRDLQMLGEFDTTTSSWVQTPAKIRKLGGALFCDRRYDTVFVYHNGAESYYAARGFRGLLRV